MKLKCKNINKKAGCTLQDNFYCNGVDYQGIEHRNCVYNRIDELILSELRLIRQELKSLYQRPVETPDECENGCEFESMDCHKNCINDKPEPSEPLDSRCAGCKGEGNKWCQPETPAEDCWAWVKKEDDTPAELFGEGFGNAYNEAMMSTNKENL